MPANVLLDYEERYKRSLSENCRNTEFFLVRIQENTGQYLIINSVFEHFSRSGYMYRQTYKIKTMYYQNTKQADVKIRAHNKH